MLWGDLDGWDGVGKRETSKREGIYVYILDDSLHCIAETNTILQSNYMPIKN